MRTGPLIEEMNDQDMVGNISIPLNKQSASFMDAIRSLSSEKEIQKNKIAAFFLKFVIINELFC